MKDYILLRWSQFNHYRYLSDYVPLSNLKFLVNFFSGDYKSYDKNLFNRLVSCYDEHFVYNDTKNKIFYIGWSEWEYSDGDMHCPDDQEFPTYVNEVNSFKISHDNFIELAEKLMRMQKNPMPFAIIYRDNNDWVDCKGFDTKEEMELFVKNYKPEVAH